MSSSMRRLFPRGLRPARRRVLVTLFLLAAATGSCSDDSRDPVGSLDAADSRGATDARDAARDGDTAGRPDGTDADDADDEDGRTAADARDGSTGDVSDATDGGEDCDGDAAEGCQCDFDGTSEGVCSDGAIDDKGRCDAPDDYSSSETACDGADNDCDGVTDEECSCDYDGKTKGVCGNAAIDASTGRCDEPASYEQDESTCDSKDNDCDGEVDEGCDCQDGATDTCYRGPAGTAGTGDCKQGTRTCTGGSWGSCMNETTPSKESCNGDDDDCDNVVDEGCSCDYNGTSTGVCSDGKIDSRGTCQSPSDYSQTETQCDGEDNDCDGATDEGCLCDYKGDADGVCGKATRDKSGTCAEPGSYQQDEGACDAKDNDCDGEVDEGCDCRDGETENCYTGPQGTQGVGECTGGKRSCTNGTWTMCSDTTPTTESCDGNDNNCNGVTNEGCPCDYQGRSDGVCASQTIDTNGDCEQPDDYEGTESSCADGADNDCDGNTDCADSACSGDACGAGNGAVCKSGDCTETACEDDLDNDGDGDIDCEDAECTCGSGAVCRLADCEEANCSDGADNDGDGGVDCDDSDCAGDACGTGSGAVCSSGVCTETACKDGVDNDGDGDVDCEDTECSCGSGETCSNGQCVCQPDCSGKQCGGDGCGGSCGSCGSAEICSSNQCKEPTFSGDVMPIIRNAGCGSGRCHGGGAPAASLDLSSRSTAYNDLVGVPSTQCSNRLRIEAGAASSSYLVDKLQGRNLCFGSQMPKGGSPLSNSDITTIRAWINAGAKNN